MVTKMLYVNRWKITGKKKFLIAKIQRRKNLIALLDVLKCILQDLHVKKIGL